MAVLFLITRNTLSRSKGVGAPMSSDEDPWQLSCGKKGAFRNPSKLKKSISQTQQKTRGHN